MSGIRAEKFREWHLAVLPAIIALVVLSAPSWETKDGEQTASIKVYANQIRTLQMRTTFQ